MKEFVTRVRQDDVTHISIWQHIISKDQKHDLFDVSIFSAGSEVSILLTKEQMGYIVKQISQQLDKE